MARSSLAAEVQALSEGEQEQMLCRFQWAEMLNKEVNPREPHLALAAQRAAMGVDAKTVFNAVQKGETASSAYSMKEKYAALELMSVAENLRLQGTKLLCVSSDAQLSDELTKSSAQDMLKAFLQQGQWWRIIFDPMFTASKKKPKAERMQSVPEKTPSSTSPEWALSMLDLIRHDRTPFGLLGV